MNKSSLVTESIEQLHAMLARELKQQERYADQGKSNMVEFVEAEYINPIREAIDTYSTNPNLDNAQVGDHVTELLYSDQHSMTIVERTANRIVATRDNVERLTEPTIIPGGFAGHCTNQRSIKYRCTSNPDGARVVFTRRKNGEYIKQGCSIKSRSGRIMNGSHEFYDYNF